jgi:hypothetical protein
MLTWIVIIINLTLIADPLISIIVEIIQNSNIIEPITESIQNGNIIEPINESIQNGPEPISVNPPAKAWLSDYMTDDDLWIFHYQCTRIVMAIIGRL